MKTYSVLKNQTEAALIVAQKLAEIIKPSFKHLRDLDCCIERIHFIPAFDKEGSQLEVVFKSSMTNVCEFTVRVEC